jgi:hypothetical protein
MRVLPTDMRDVLRARSPLSAALPTLRVPQTLTPSQRNIVRVQHWLLFPVLLLARLSWCMQSMTFPFNGKVSGKKAWPEVVTIAGHYSWLLSAAFTWLSPLKVCCCCALQ